MSKPLTIGLYRHYRSAALRVFTMAAPFLLASAQELPAGHLVVEGSDCAMMGDFASSQSQTVRFRLRNAGTSPVGIKAISKSCNCADAEASTNRVEAGGTAVITKKSSGILRDLRAFVVMILMAIPSQKNPLAFPEHHSFPT